MSARQHAWDRLGTVVPDTFTAAEAMEHASLGGWNVHKEPLTTTVVTYDGVSTLTVPDQFAPTARSAARRRQGYRPIQNEEHADLLNALIDESGAHFETAGSLRAAVRCSSP